VQALQAWGMSVTTETSKQFAESLNKAVLESDPYFNQIVRIMATRCMTQAKYFSSGAVSPSAFLHYGLAAPIYTHFTSPIRRCETLPMQPIWAKRLQAAALHLCVRATVSSPTSKSRNGCRYADVLVHRCLAASLGLKPLPEALKDREHMEVIVDNMNDRHTNAARCGRSSAQLHTLVFFRDREQIADARVIKVQSNGMIALVPKFGIEGPVYFGAGNSGDDDARAGASLNEEKQVHFCTAVVQIVAICGMAHRSQPSTAATGSLARCWLGSSFLHTLGCSQVFVPTASTSEQK
jgi:exosome complex exonuclease DIS3/RRP44